MISLAAWRSARADVLRVLRIARLWAWATVPLTLACLTVSIVLAPRAWQIPVAVLPALASEAVRRLVRSRHLATATHDSRAAIGHELQLLPAPDVASLLLRGAVIYDGLQIAADAEADAVRLETHPVPHSSAPPLTTIFARNGGAGGAF